MSYITISPITDEFNGDINVEGGMLGFTIIDNITSNINLWTTYPEKPHRYLLTNTSGGVRTVTLPVVGTNSGQAIPGHCLLVINSSNSTDNIIVETSDSSSLQTITPGNYFEVIATTNPAIWRTSLDSLGIQGGVNLQTAYNNGDGSITLDNTNNAVNIIGATNDPAQSLFTINNNDSSETYFDIQNTSATNFEPALSLNGGSATAADSVAIGNNATASNSGSMILSDGQNTVETTTDNQLVLNFSNGVLGVGGSVLPGTADNDPNCLTVYSKVSTTNASWTTFYTLTTVIDTSYSIKALTTCSITGVPGNKEGNASYNTLASCSNDNGTSFVENYINDIISGSQVSSTDLRVQTSGSNILIQVKGKASTNITWISCITISSYKWN